MNDIELIKDFNDENSERKLPEIIGEQFTQLQKLRQEVSEARDKARDAKDAADAEAQEKIRFGKHKQAIGNLRTVTTNLAEAQIKTTEVQTIMLEYQQKLAEVMKYLLAQGMASIATNRAVQKEIKRQMQKGTSEGTFDEQTLKELANLMKQLKAQEDIFSKQDATDEKLKQHETRLRKSEKQENEQNIRIEEGLKKDIQQDMELERQAEKDAEHDRLIAERTKKDNEQDTELKRQAKKDAEHDKLIAEEQKKGKQRDVLILEGVEKDIKQDQELKRQADKDIEHDMLIKELTEKTQALEEQLEIFSNKISEVENSELNITANGNAINKMEGRIIISLILSGIAIGLNILNFVI